MLSGQSLSCWVLPQFEFFFYKNKFVSNSFVLNIFVMFWFYEIVCFVKDKKKISEKKIFGEIFFGNPIFLFYVFFVEKKSFMKQVCSPVVLQSCSPVVM